MPYDQLGKLLIGVGVAVVVVDVVLLLLGRTSIGRLTGDITFTNDPVTVVVPLAIMLLLSLLLTIVANVLLRIFNR